MAERLRGQELIPGCVFEWASPQGRGVLASYRQTVGEVVGSGQTLLLLDSAETDPVAASADMIDQLLSKPVESRAEVFGWQP